MKPSFIIANIIRSPSDPHAQVLCETGALRKYFCGTRNFTKGIPKGLQKLYPLYGMLAYAAYRSLHPYYGESARFALCPSFERRVIKSIQPGDHIIGGIGYLNHCIEKVHETGGLALLDARNSHPSSFWTIMAEEYARWGYPMPPIYPKHHLRQQRSVALADYFFVPSHFVRDSFINAGIPPEKLLYLPYPVELSTFSPPAQARPADRPLTLSCAGGCSFRKGTPYLFEALRIIQREVPDVRLKITGRPGPQIRPLFQKHGYDKLPIEFHARMSHPELVKWLHGSDVYVLPSLEEGMVRSAAEAMACGLPVVTTPHSGINDAIMEDVCGSIVPIREPQAIADAVLKWWDRIRSGEYIAAEAVVNQHALGFETFRTRFLQHLKNVGFEIDLEMIPLS
jgi:glycosyltransferase involved in cell wall biosynthesis